MLQMVEARGDDPPARHIGRNAKYMRFVTEMDSEEVKRAFAREGTGG